MSNITLHPKHGLAPALTFCYVCGGETNEITLLGRKADIIAKQMGQNEYGYCTRVPSPSLCTKCESHLQIGGTILIGKDTKQFLMLTQQMIYDLHGRVADAKGRFLDFKAMEGKVITLKKAFWYQDGGNIRLRDPKEWTV